MKKILAMALALTFTASVFTACGKDDSASSSDASSSSEAAATTTAAPEDSSEAPEDSSAADSSEGDSSAAEEETDGPRDISELPDELSDEDTYFYNNASLKFTADTDLAPYSMFNEAKNDLYPGDEGYKGDEAILNIDIEELSGIPMLHLSEQLYAKNEDGTDKNQGFKLRMDMSQIFAGNEDKLADIFGVNMDVVAVAKTEWHNDTDGQDYLVPAWLGGAFGTNNNGQWNGNLTEWKAEEYTSSWTVIPMSIRPGIKGGDAAFNKDNETNYLTFMVWPVSVAPTPARNVDFYIADIQFVKEDKTVITLD